MGFLRKIVHENPIKGIKASERNHSTEKLLSLNSIDV